jgi:hypothetical protein
VKLVHQVLSTPDLEEVFSFANERLALSHPDENERMFASWTVAWRREALEHYLKLGWSFIVREEVPAGSTEKPKAVGFFLAQPFLFFRGQTQTLWVEHIEAVSDEVTASLVEVAVKVAREKHLQRAIFSDAERLAPQLKAWNPTKLDEPIAVVRTTKG